MEEGHRHALDINFFQCRVLRKVLPVLQQTRIGGDQASLRVLEPQHEGLSGQALLLLTLQGQFLGCDFFLSVTSIITSLHSSPISSSVASIRTTISARCAVAHRVTSQ